MTTRRPVPIAAPRASPIYSWHIDAGVLHIAGPLSRPALRRRSISLLLSEIPAALGHALLAQGDEVAEPFAVGRRTLQILRSAADAGFILHLTVERQRTRALTSYLQWLEEGIDALPEAFVLYDADDRLLIGNRQYSELYPTIADLLQPGIPFRSIATAASDRGQFIHEEGAESWLRRRVEFHDKGEGYFDQHLNDGRWVQLSERRTRSGGVTSIRADITLLKAREEALRHAMLNAESTSRSMARFLATFSHEMRNGLNGVAGLAQLLAFDAESEPQSGRADLMLQSTRRLTTVLTDLLDYLKNEAIGVAIKLEPVSPRALLETLRAELEPQAAQRQIGLHWGLPEDVPAWIEADPGRILQVLANLAGNALKHAQRGAVSIGLAVVESKIRFAVEDEGVGIAAEDLGGLFEYFVSARSDRASSTGLGLAICKQLVLAMGGQIGVDSELGRGSRFWFELPLRLAEAPTPSIVAAGANVLPAALRVGIIDDDPLNRTVAEALLLRLGHHAMVFENSHELFERIQRDGLDVLLLDLMMPGESGFEVARRLRSQPSTAQPSLVLIALTGNVVPDSLTSCANAGIDAILQKPLFLDQLKHALDWATRRERPILTGTPEVFVASKVAELMDASVLDAQSSLSQLAEDIGNVRFIQSVRSARKLFEQAIQATATERKTLRRIAHRVAGTAPQLGFGHLGDCARAIDTHLSIADDKSNDDALKEYLSRMHQAARDAFGILDEQLLRVQRSSPRAKR